MALQSILESIEGLDEVLKSEYKKAKVGDKEVYVLDISGVNNHPDVKSLKSALDRQKNDNKEIKTKLDEAEAKLQDIPDDFTTDEWARLQALDTDDTEEGKRRKKQLEDERLATLRKQLETKHANELAAAVTRAEKAEATAAEATAARAGDKAETLLTEALTKAGVKPTLMRAAKALHKGYIKSEVSEDEGLRVFVETDMGEQEVEKYIETWAKSDDGKDFIVAAAGGDSGGTQRLNGGLSGDNPFTRGAWSKTAQANLFRTDKVKAERLAKSAGFKNLDVAIKASSAIVPDKQ